METCLRDRTLTKARDEVIVVHEQDILRLRLNLFNQVPWPQERP
jgi:hypothetical protein